MNRDGHRPGDGRAKIRVLTDAAQLLEASAPTPGAALIAAGEWLAERHGTGQELIVESIGWHLPVGAGDDYTVVLALAKSARHAGSH